MILPLAQAAATGVGQVRELVTYELGRLTQFDEPRTMWLVVGAATVLLVGLAIRSYYRERHALRTPWRVLMTGLRIVALLALALFFLGPEKRIDKETQTDSQVVLLVDTSQSMSVEDEQDNQQSKATRSAAVRQLIASSQLVSKLQQEHDVVLATFDEKTNRVMRWDRVPAELKPENNAESDPNNDVEENTQTSASTDWQTLLEPRGGETRLGNALRSVLQAESGGPLAGVVVFSDGGQNTGVEPLEIADLAKEQLSPIYTVGVGSTKARKNLRVQELSVPSRVYPDDKATVSCLIQSEGFAGRTVEVELYAREASSPGTAGDRIGSERITFNADEEVVPLKFDFEPAEVGRLALQVRIVAPHDDQYAADNQREAEVDVVDTESRVLLIASGATRDYRFLRNQLRRDKHMIVDVWLQLSPPGISQDADQLLLNFPETKAELFEYDCIVAFDPNWTMLDARQVDMLEAWVAEEAGGMIVIAGPIHTSTWVQSPEHTAIRSLYPVQFQRRLSLLEDGLYGSTTPWPLEFTRDGTDSDFLWLGNSTSESRLLWSQFDGVYGCYATKGPKPGARVLAYYSDPDAGISADRPVYLAEHFYGAGRVLYFGSSELWRLRSLGVEYYEVLYTQLIRHVSQGRLLRGSTLGRLLIQRDRYSIGDEVVVRAQLSSASREPLIAERVIARIVSPDGKGRNLTMKADPERPGNFVGQFNVRQEGAYRIELPVPDALDQQLSRRLQVVAPNLEFDKTRRDESLLVAIANRSGGRYYTSLSSALKGNSNLQPVANMIESRAEMQIVRGLPDHDFTESLNRILLCVICGALCLEWLLRRLLRLA